MKSQSESSRRHYLKFRDKRRAGIKARKLSVRIFVQEYKKGHPCVCCGESEPCCLDFHHVKPEEKFGLINRMAHYGFSIESVSKEIMKCEILCANCHRKKHFKIMGD